MTIRTVRCWCTARGYLFGHHADDCVESPTYSDPLPGPAEDATRLRAVREVAGRRHLYTELRHYADAVDQALDGPHTQGEDA